MEYNKMFTVRLYDFTIIKTDVDMNTLLSVSKIVSTHIFNHLIFILSSPVNIFRLQSLYKHRPIAV